MAIVENYFKEANLKCIPLVARSSYEFFSGAGVITFDFSDQPIVTLSNVRFSGGNYSAIIGNAGN